MTMSSAPAGRELLDRIFGDLARGQHHPDGARLLLERLTSSFSEADALAPSFASASRGFAVYVETTHWCPAFIRRRAMLPPMRPSPTMPICIVHSLQIALFERRIHGASQLGQALVDVLEMDAQRAAAAFHQHLEIPARLRSLHHAEAVVMAGHVDVGRVIAGDLQEHAGIRAALVGLPGRMLEARSEAEAGRGAGLVADARAHRGQRLRVRFVALDVGEQRDVVAVRRARGRMALQIAGQCLVPAELAGVARIGVERHAVLAEDRRLFRQACDFSYSSVSARVLTLLASTSG